MISVLNDAMLWTRFKEHLPTILSWCQYKMYESRVVTVEVEERRKLTNKLYEN